MKKSFQAASIKMAVRVEKLSYISPRNTSLKLFLMLSDTVQSVLGGNVVFFVDSKMCYKMLQEFSKYLGKPNYS